MKKLSKEKRNQLVLIGMGTVGVMAALWFLLLSAQMQKISSINAKIADTEKEIAKRKQVKKEAPVVQTKLEQCEARLGQVEGTMPAGQPYAWINSRLHQFNTPNYRVDMQVPGYPQLGDVAMLPNFPYHQLDVGIGGTAYYYDIGKFIADFENRNPCMRIQNLNLDVGGGGGGDDREKLSYRMDIIILTKNETL